MSETADHEPGCNGEQAPPSGEPSLESPVEPPSAGFLVRLFVVPSLLVMAVIGVWLLFGKPAAGEQDWRILIQDVGSNDPHRRWSGVIGLAQLLQADREIGPQSERLSRNPRVAEGLSNLLRGQLARRSGVAEDDLRRLEFLARTLGFLDVPETTLPVLREAMLAEHDPQRDRHVRKSALAAVAVTAGRRFEQDRPLDDPGLVNDLVKVSQDGDRLMRRLGAYTLGLVSGEAAGRRLAVLLGDSDADTRVNAAIGLARRKSTAGFPVFETVLAEAARLAESTESPQAENAESDQFERLLILGNVLKAVDLLAGELTSEERSDLVDLLEPIAQRDPVRRLRAQASQTLSKLRL